MIIYLRKHFILYATSFIVEKDIIRIFYWLEISVHGVQGILCSEVYMICAIVC